MFVAYLYSSMNVFSERTLRGSLFLFYWMCRWVVLRGECSDIVSSKPVYRNIRGISSKFVLSLICMRYAVSDLEGESLCCFGKVAGAHLMINILGY